jgi:asparagine synthase (glutamine-hydrolysing)
MCGIAGVFSNNISVESQKSLTQKMLYKIKHRGPDNSDTWEGDSICLGHNRLSIIDLSNEANQPFHYLHLTIVFNGEIYNYIEVKDMLSKKGYSFQTESDTEVILAAYLEWGQECVNYFMGMWAFALWDSKNKTLFCSRDRFGIKPFYYIFKDQSFYFASEYKALKSLPIFENHVNLDQVARGLQMGWVTYKDETYFEQIKQIPAASNIFISNLEKPLEVFQYWDIDFSKKFEGTFNEKKEAFRNALIESIELHMRSDVVVGACLSGGIDSSTIASVVGKFKPDTTLNTFTIYYDGKGDVDERPFAEEVTNQYPSLKPHYLMPDDSNLANDFEKIQYHQDIPLPGSSPISQYYVMKLAKEHQAKVLLDGQGSDEFLAGYLHSFFRIIGDNIFSSNPINGLNIWSKHSNIQEFTIKERYTRLGKSIISGIFDENYIYQKEYLHALPFLPSNNHEVFDLEKRDTTKLNEFLYNLTFTTSLPTLLHFEDRNSMAFSIESRVPFLDHRLVELAFSFMDEDKIGNGISKNILREAMRGIIPDSIANRMDKKGFVTPGEVKWLRGPLKHLIDDIDYTSLNMLNTSKIKELIHDYKKGDNSNAKLIWRVATLNQWYNTI